MHRAENSTYWWDWAVNGEVNGNPGEILRRGESLRRLELKINRRVPYSELGDFREEMERAIAHLARAAYPRKISLALSGIDSECLAILLRKLHVDFDLWHLRMDFRPESDLEILREISRRLDARLHIVPFSWRRHREVLRSAVLHSGIQATIMHCLPILFAEIPHENFILTGHGTFRKYGPRYRKLVQSILQNPEDRRRGRPIPLDFRNVLMRIWLRESGRVGELYFHTSCEREVGALFKDPAMEYNAVTGEIDDKKVFQKYFPEALFREKTEPWNSTTVRREWPLVKIQGKWLQAQYPQWEASQRDLFAPLFVDEIFA